MVKVDSKRALIAAFVCAALLSSWPTISLAATPVIQVDINAEALTREPPTNDVDRTLRVVSFNLNRFFDDVDNGNNEEVVSSNQFQKRLKRMAKAIGAGFGQKFETPDLIALQEVENINVLRRLSDLVEQQFHVRYQTILISGQDVSGINLGFLLRQEFSIVKAEQLFVEQKLRHESSPLFSRPPLKLDFCDQSKCLSVVNLHLRSMRGINSQRKGSWVRKKRLQQAEMLASWSHRFQKNKPKQAFLLLGDLNALTPSDPYVDVAGIIRGKPDHQRAKLVARDLIEPDLIDLTEAIPLTRRYSYIYRKRKQQLDYMIADNDFAKRLTSIKFSRINRRLSDHAALLAEFNW